MANKPTTKVLYGEQEVMVFLVNNGFDFTDVKRALSESIKSRRTYEMISGRKVATINWTKNTRMIYAVTIKEI